MGLLVARWAALAAVIATPLTGSTLLAVLSIIAFLLQTLTNVSRRGLYLRNLKALPNLYPGNPPMADRASLPGVTFIAPARNEEDGIEAAVRSVMALDYPDLEVIYLDDHSTDATPAILDRLSAEFPKLRVIHNPPVQPGWLGKANGVWHALGESDPSKPWIVIADADVVFEPDALRQAVELAVANKYDFLTCVPHCENGSLSEELFMPAGWAGLIQGAHHGRLNESRTAPIGVGAFVLVKRSVYLACGGHAAIRNRQPEDTLLAALVRRHGGNMGVCWTRHMIRVRVYRGYKQLRRFMVRKIRMQAQDRVMRLTNRIVYTLIQDILPLPLFVAACARQVYYGAFSLSMTVYAAAALLAYLSNVGSFHKYREIAYMRPGIEWFHPIGGLLRIYFYVAAALQVLGRKRMEWRGRDFSHT